MNRRLAVAVIGAVTCMALVPGVSASAAVPDADGTVHACYGKVGGVVRVIEPTRGERCLSKAESELTFNQAGQRGPAGPAGTPGPDGPAGVSPTVAQLAPGDTHCPAGGAAITDAAGSTAYVCSGATGADGRPGADGQDGAPFSGTFTSPNGAYSISVTDQGVAVSHGSSGLALTGDTLKITGGTLTIQVSGNTAVEAGGSDHAQNRKRPERAVRRIHHPEAGGKSDRRRWWRHNRDVRRCAGGDCTGHRAQWSRLSPRGPDRRRGGGVRLDRPRSPAAQAPSVSAESVRRVAVGGGPGAG